MWSDEQLQLPAPDLAHCLICLGLSPLTMSFLAPHGADPQGSSTCKGVMDLLQKCGHFLSANVCASLTHTPSSGPNSGQSAQEPEATATEWPLLGLLCMKKVPVGTMRSCCQAVMGQLPQEPSSEVCALKLCVFTSPVCLGLACNVPTRSLSALKLTRVMGHFPRSSSFLICTSEMEMYLCCG